MSTTLVGCAVPFEPPPYRGVTLVPEHPPVAEGCILLPYVRGAFADAIAARKLRLQLNYQDGLLLASQADGTLDLSQTDEGLMFEARLTDAPFHALVAEMIREGLVQHCCVTGKDDPKGPAQLVLRREESGEDVAIYRSHHDVAINLLMPGLRLRPSFVGTWVNAL